MKINSTYKIYNPSKLLFVLLIFLMGGLDNFVSGQISTLNTWTNLYHGNSNTQNITYTIPTGSNSRRVLVIGIATLRTSNGARTISITYGSRTLSSVNGDLSASTRQHTQLYYLNESGIDAATSTTLSVVISGGTTRVNDIFATVFDNADQTSPITSSRTYSSGTNTTTNPVFGTPLTVNSGNQAVEIISCVRTGSTTPRTITYATNWSLVAQQTWTTTDAVRNAVANRVVPQTNITDASLTTFSGNALASMTALSLREAPKYFRSIVTGNWNSTSTWEQSFDNSIWVPATSIPGSTDLLTTVQSGHVVSLSTDRTTGSLLINGTLDLVTYNLTGTGIFAVSTPGSLLIGGTSNFPTGFSTTTLSPGSTVNYYRAGTQTISNRTYANLTLSGTSAKTFPAGTTSINGLLSREGTASVILTGSLTYGANATLKYKGSAAQITGTEFPSTFNGSGGVIIENANGVSLGASRTIQSQLILSNGRLMLGSYNLTTSVISGSFSVANMVVVGGAGELRRIIQVNGSYLFPVGETSGTAEYSPLTLDFTSGSYALGAYAGVRVTNAKHPNNGSVSNYLNRYWSVSQSGISAYMCNINGIYLPADISGSESSQVAARYSGTLPWIKYSVLASNTLTAVGITNLVGDFTGINDIPTITTTGGLSVFSYQLGAGPSTEQSFTVSGVDLNTNITVTSTSNMEISKGTGPAFIPTGLLTLNVIGEIVTSKAIYVRLKAGLAVGTYNDTIACSSSAAATKYIYATGTVNYAPDIRISVATLSGFNYIFGDGPSGEQSFYVVGAFLTANINITAPTNYEISKTPGSGFGSSVTLIPSEGTVASTPVYVRLKTGLISAYFDGEMITLISTGAGTKHVICNGIVFTPAISTSTTALGGFIYTAGSGLPSSEQPFTVSGAHLKNNITVTPTANFEISLTSGSGYQLTAITLSQSGGTVDAINIYVRLKSGLPLGTYSGESITLTSGGATSHSVACNGASVVNTNTIVSSVASITGISYTLGSGPSVPRSFTVSATSLTAGLIITATTNFEISLLSGSGYTPGAITFVPVSGIVAATPVYVRLKAGITPSGTVPPENISLVSAGATIQYVACSGAVFDGPIITAGGGGTICEGSVINLTSTGSNYGNQYWEGPNGFYSTIPAPVVTNASDVHNGTYTVTGSGLSGINLINNGDFESGNTGFNSSYGYVSPARNALYPEGKYTVVAIPRTAHDDFSTNPDHTATPGTMQMVINGSTDPGVVVWSQSVDVLPNTFYQFSYWEQSVVAASPSVLQLYVNGVPSGEYYTAPASINIWAPYVYNVNSGSATVASLELINQNIIPGGNDFALDDIVFQQVVLAVDSVEVNVNPVLPVSISIVASATTIYTGTPVTFTATPVSGGSSPAYQWKLNGLDVGTNSSTYINSTLADGDDVSCVISSTAACVSGSPATSNSLVMEVTARQNYWVGGTSIYWSVPANWSAGYEPVAGDDVEYASITNGYGSDAVRDLQLDADKTIGSLINATSRRLVIPAGLCLIVNNNISTNNNDTIIYIRSGSTGPNGSLIFHNPSDLPVYATVEMYSRASINPEGGYHNIYNWQYFGIPLESVRAEPTFYGSYVRRWEETGDTINTHWISLTNSSVLVPFYGYEICHPTPRKIIFQGQLVNRDFDSGQLAKTATAMFPGQHIFANPYTAAIDIRQLVFGNDTESTVYLYNTGTFGAWETAGGTNTLGYSPGQYVAVPKNTAGYGQLPRQIPSMQGVLIRAMNSSADATFRINYNSVVMRNDSVLRAPGVNPVTPQELVFIRIDVKSMHYSDRMWIFSDPACTRGFDNGWDGEKISGSVRSPQLFAMEEDGNYQVNAVADIHDMVLGFQAGEAGEDTLIFTHQHIGKYYAGVYLVDMAENKIIDITDSGTGYAFVAAPDSTPVKRFKIVTRPYEKNASDAVTDLKIFSAQGNIFVQNFSNQNGSCMLFDIAGHCLQKVPVTANGMTVVAGSLIPGAYVALAATAKEKVSKRLIVR